VEDMGKKYGEIKKGDKSVKGTKKMKNREGNENTTDK
jgi:hypothetical protein